MKYLLFLIPLFYTSVASCKSKQDSIDINFNISLGKNSITQENYVYSLKFDDSLRIETVKFYISNLTLIDKKGNETSFAKRHHLIDFEDRNTLSLTIKDDSVNSYNRIRFNLGVDSLTNVSGAQDGDLDPIHGMYWTWQSGYINFKLEGTYAKCPARKNKFQFHLGGYQEPFNTYQSVELKLEDQNDITVNVDLEVFLSNIDLTETFEIMSPNEKAIELSGIAVEIFSVKK